MRGKNLSPIFIFCIIYDQISIIYGARYNKRCNYNLEVLWTKEIGHSPFASAPIITDINADGNLDIIAAPFLDEITILHGENGHILKTSKWPYPFVDISTHSSPLSFDINGDHINDVVIVSTSGKMLFFHHDGTLLNNFTSQLPPLQVQKDWYKKVLSADRGNVHDHILDSNPDRDQVKKGYVNVDAHVLATPVIVDINRDSIIEEMIIPVSYYFDTDLYSNVDELPVPFPEMMNYLVGAILVFNLTSLSIVNTFHLELTKVKSGYPSYLLSSPTVIDLDGNGSPLEIIIGTSGGRIHALNLDGTTRDNFPIVTDSIHSQILASDINLDGKLELVAVDVGANVICYDASGNIVWESDISGTSSDAIRVVDIDLDGQQELVISTNDGKIWFLSASTGKPLPGWPFRVGKSHTTMPLVTQLSDDGSLDLIMVSDEENLHIVSGDNKCRHVITLGEKTLVQILSQDLVKSSPGLELLLATDDGTLMCIGHPTAKFDLMDPIDFFRFVSLQSLPATTKTYNDFSLGGKKGVYIVKNEVGVLDITGSGYYLQFELWDEIPKPEFESKLSSEYQVLVYFGNQLLHKETVIGVGEHYIYINTPDFVAIGHLALHVINQYGLLYKEEISVRFNMLHLQDLPWLLFCPFVMMAIILLVLHGYPLADLLPITVTDKAR